MHAETALRKIIRESFTGTVTLIIDNKEVVKTIYRGQHGRNKIIGDWYAKYQLTHNDFELRIKPKA